MLIIDRRDAVFPFPGVAENLFHIRGGSFFFVFFISFFRHIVQSCSGSAVGFATMVDGISLNLIIWIRN
ncbi:hypothetical protein BDV30DRAFT_212651 [Aspergillus minisclerotigenes]|uniref:Uncharacterized protein n=1 Tax=Aspergillus minisclerotigenes TaxID=656917 RepID=A0A5N6IZK9_9EURO|nr:hypothetical protein BDV30DRAFT_212651 [Aspergillus minisclerotigenes]